MLSANHPSICSCQFVYIELVAPSLPRYYLGNAEAGVKEMQLILDAPIGPASTLPLIVEYPSVSLVYHYTSGSKVRGA